MTMEYITSNQGGRKLAFENNICIKQKVLSNGTVWGDFVQGDFVRGDFVQGDFVRGDFVLGGILSRGILSGGFCPGGFVRGDFVLEPLPTTFHKFTSVFINDASNSYYPPDCLLPCLSPKQHNTMKQTSTSENISSVFGGILHTYPQLDLLVKPKSLRSQT